MIAANTEFTRRPHPPTPQQLSHDAGQQKNNAGSNADAVSDARMQTLFLAMLPTIVKYGRLALRNLTPEARDDGLHEVIANCFVAFARLVERGKTELAYPTVLVRFAVAQFRVGRRVGCSLNSNEVYSRFEQGKCDIPFCHLGSPGEQHGGWKELLVGNHRTSIGDLAAIRIDFPRWLDSLPTEKRRVAEDLMVGERTKDVAANHRVSPGRVSQIRRELEESWEEFVGEASEVCRVA